MRNEGGRMKDLRERTREFGIRIVRLYVALPKSPEAQILGRQVLRSGTSVGAHYREAMRARSDTEFISKLEGGMQELEETMYWFELLTGSGITSEQQLADITDEANQLMSIMTTIVKKRKSQS
jgi:four helix bundle protein